MLVLRIFCNDYYVLCMRRLCKCTYFFTLSTRGFGFAFSQVLHVRETREDTTKTNRGIEGTPAGQGEDVGGS